MTTDLETRPVDPLERRLRAACREVIPHLLYVDEGSHDSMLDVERVPVTDDLDATVAPLRIAGRSRLVSIAAAVLVLAGVGAVWSAQRRDHAQPASGQQTAPDSTVPLTVLSPISESSAPCYDYGCAALDRLPVVVGATDFYAGPDALGVPQVAIDYFDSLTRCAELNSEFSACQRIEGIAGVSLVTYATETTTVDTTARSESSFATNIGTTFTDLSPTQYAAQWTVSGAGPATLTPLTVRGHDGVRYTYVGAPGVVWQERPGVLVWVSTPPESEDQLMTIAEGIRRLDGPTTIPNRVMVSPLAEVWDAGSNDGNGVLVASAGGTECVGLDYLETCGEDITVRTVVRAISEPSGTTRVAGSTPAGVSSVRIDITGGAPITVETITFANYASRFYSTTVSGGEVESVTWLDDQGNEIESSVVSAPPLDVASDPPATETVP